MPLVLATRYASITGDTDTAASAVEEALVEAIDALEDVLDRPLAEEERTELLRPYRDGRLWPRATPITDGGDYQVDGEGLRYSTPWPAAPFGVLGDEQTGVSVTYTGGFVERSHEDNIDAPNRLPTYIERDLCFAAWRLLHPPALTASNVPAGAVSAQVGDVSVSYGPGGARSTSDVLDGVWSRMTLGWRYAPIGSPQ
jgi:hypothetical protein